MNLLKQRSWKDFQEIVERMIPVCVPLLDGTDALVLMTAHREFRELDLRRVKEGMRTPIIIDGRRVFEQSEMRGLMFVYRGVGRGMAGKIP